MLSNNKNKQFENLYTFAQAHEIWEISMVQCELCWNNDENLYPNLCQTHASLLLALQDLRNKALYENKYYLEGSN